MNEVAPASAPDRSSAGAGGPLLEVVDLHVRFDLARGPVRAVQGLSLEVRTGERLGVVGESGSGKSVTALAIMRMVPWPGRITGGHVRFQGHDLGSLAPAQMRRIRGGQIGLIPQSSLTALNPVLTVGAHFQEVLSLHLGLGRRERRERTLRLLESVGIPDPAARLREHPHRLSGGQRQRVMIALAMACQPRLLIADEPTTALDVTIQAQILELFDDLVARFGLGAILITHNLGIVAGHCDRVAVMYAGRAMEVAPVADLFARPAHPYTLGLLRCVPRLTPTRSRTFATIARVPPGSPEPSAGCPFAPRCDRATEPCRRGEPRLEAVGPGHAVACWHPVAGEGTA
ncbi:MAG: ABC transporter ATP-binding protein [Gemmatimonadota bacterium]